MDKATSYELDPSVVPELSVISTEYDSVDYSVTPAGRAVDQIASGIDETLFPPSVIDINQIMSCGVPIDGIPPIDSPQYLKPAEATYIESNEPVVSIEVNGDARAFPIKVLMSHEIVNTEIGGIPVTVTYCPLCNSALAYDRRVGDRVLDFGVSGTLYNSALIMYDRPTGSLWGHFTGEGFVGHYAGLQLSLIPTQTLSFGEFTAAMGDAMVLSNESEHGIRAYSRNPYIGEDPSPGTSGMLFRGTVDERLPRKERVVGIFDYGGSAIAIPFEVLNERRVVVLDKDSKNGLVVFYIDGLSSPLDTSNISQGRDVGQTGVFKPAVNGQELTFKNQPDGEIFTDDQTGSTWNILGRAIDGELDGAVLEPVAHLDAFWFAWAAYRPDTKIYS